METIPQNLTIDRRDEIILGLLAALIGLAGIALLAA